jgi:putative endonuclease
MKHYIYILKCADGTLYTGYTTDIEKREDEHNGIGESASAKKLGAKYTRSRRPVKLIYSEQFATKSEAMKREYEIKQLSRTEKQTLLKKKQTRKN